MHCPKKIVMRQRILDQRKKVPTRARRHHPGNVTMQFLNHQLVTFVYKPDLIKNIVDNVIRSMIKHSTGRMTYSSEIIGLYAFEEVFGFLLYKKSLILPVVILSF